MRIIVVAMTISNRRTWKMADILTRQNVAEQPVTNQAAKRGRKGVFLKWLRKSHGWVGLWAIVLTVLFGVTGFLQNHRATLRPERVDVSTLHVALPSVRFETPEALAAFLRLQLDLDRPAERTRREPARPVPWGGRSVMQPERWEVRFTAPEYTITAEYWKGEGVVEVKRQQRGPIGALEALHKAAGTSPGWALLSDSVAIGLVFLSLTGLLLWLKLERRRTVGLAILSLSVIAAVFVTVQSL